MTGNASVFGLWSLAFVRLHRRIGFRVSAQGGRQKPRPKAKDQRPNSGFTLLELLIVMFVIVILAAVALPQYQRTIVHTRETVLKDDLYKMRAMIDQYAADKGKLPQSLQELVEAKYMREIPLDPMTNEASWQEVMGEDPNSREGAQGLIDVHSLSTDTSSEEEGNKAYSEW